MLTARFPFFIACALAVAPAMAAGELADLGETPTVAGRIARIERFVDAHYFDDQGLMYSHINWREECPFTAADFSSADSTMPGPDPWEWMSYENSPFISGLLLTAQCYRYEATGDVAALALAQKAFHSLDVNYGLTEARDRAAEGPEQRAGFIGQATAGGAKAGFFCKPYYQQATDGSTCTRLPPTRFSFERVPASGEPVGKLPARPPFHTVGRGAGQQSSRRNY
ncbi:MAG: hypothetical protein RIS54_2272 [Verrucomicrobiota bacterium]|jgi:hypothetical protein